MTFLIAHSGEQAPVETVFLRGCFEVFLVAGQDLAAMTQESMSADIVKLPDVTIKPLRQFGHEYAGLGAVEKVESPVAQRIICAARHNPGNGLNFTQSKCDIEVRKVRTHEAKFVRVHQRKIQLAVRHHLQQVRRIQLAGFPP